MNPSPDISLLLRCLAFALLLAVAGFVLLLERLLRRSTSQRRETAQAHQTREQNSERLELIMDTQTNKSATPATDAYIEEVNPGFTSLLNFTRTREREATDLRERLATVEQERDELALCIVDRAKHEGFPPMYSQIHLPRVEAQRDQLQAKLEEVTKASEDGRPALSETCDRLAREAEEAKGQYVRLHTAVANGLSWASTLDQLDKVSAELAEAKELIREIRDDEVNAQDEADKFLREGQPSELSRVRAQLTEAKATIESLSDHGSGMERMRFIDAQQAEIERLKSGA